MTTRCARVATNWGYPSRASVRSAASSACRPRPSWLSTVWSGSDRYLRPPTLGQRKVEQARKARVEIRAAQLVEPSRALVVLAQHAGLAQHPKVPGRRRLAHRQPERPARDVAVVAVECGDDAQAHRIGQRRHDVGQVEVVGAGLLERGGRAAGHIVSLPQHVLTSSNMSYVRPMTNIDRDALRQQLGRIGVWSSAIGQLDADDERKAVAGVERLGYRTLWLNETVKEVFAHAGLARAAPPGTGNRWRPCASTWTTWTPTVRRCPGCSRLCAQRCSNSQPLAVPARPPTWAPSNTPRWPATCSAASRCWRPSSQWCWSPTPARPARWLGATCRCISSCRTTRTTCARWASRTRTSPTAAATGSSTPSSAGGTWTRSRSGSARTSTLGPITSASNRWLAPTVVWDSTPWRPWPRRCSPRVER